MNILQTLQNIDFFRDLDRDSLEILAKGVRALRLSPKEMLFHEGFEGTYFYILLSGSIRVFKTAPDGKESTIKLIYPGEIFAEAVLFKEVEYPASTVAVEESEIIAIHRNSFMTMMENKKARTVFTGALFEKLRYLTEQIHFLTSYDVEDRFFRFIAENYGKHYRYDITIPKKDIASAIGTIPETFSRLILRLTNRGIIGWKKDILIIKDNFWEEEYIDF